jgi:hypothetical protein
MSPKKKDWKNKLKGSSQMATTSKIERFMTTLFIYVIYKDTWFVESETS